MRAPLPVLTAVTGRWEASLASGLGAVDSGVDVVRRCADLGELLSVAAAGLGRAALVSADLPRLDRAAVSELLRARIAVVGLVQPGDDDGSLRLIRLGVTQVLAADAPPAQVATAILAAVRDLPGRLAAGKAPAPPILPSVHDLDDVERTSRPTLFADPGASLAPAPRRPPPRSPGSMAPPGTAPDAPDLQGKVVAVWGPVGAPGRTTFAVNLAAELAERGRHCLLVDADTYGASIAQTLGLLDESAGLAAAARAANAGQLDVVKLAGLAPVVSERLRVLTGLPQPRRWPELRPSALEVVWEQARRLAHCTVIDAGFGLDADEELMFDTAAPRRHGAVLSAISAADLVVAVGAGDPIGLQRLLAALPDLRELTQLSIPVQVVITKVRDPAIGGSAARRITGALERYAGVTDPVIMPDDRPALDAAMLAGRSLAEIAPASPARRAISALAGQLLSPGGILDDGETTGSPAPARLRAGRSMRGWERK
jgi:MinD-like ATPase involved in chromosome partitioning or flagellar assembly